MPYIIEHFQIFKPQEKLDDLFAAVEEGSLFRVRQALDRKKLIYARNTEGQSILHVAILKNHQDIIRYLVKNYPRILDATDVVSF